jgi:uncharacterized protein with NRDE domain
MCLILFAYQVHPRYPLIVLANRDEFYERPTRAASFWPENPQLLAGKDLRAGGTWLALSQSGRLAAITNYREPDNNRRTTKSRGFLTEEFVSGKLSARQYLSLVDQQADQYAGFNLLLGSAGQLHYYSNREHIIRQLSPGIYGLSNHLLDTPWQKVLSGKKALQEALSDPSPEKLWPILLDRQLAADEQLPDTGIGKESEKLLSSRFIHSAHYGTRACSIVLKDNNGNVQFLERNFDYNGELDATSNVQFSIAATG